MNITSQKGQTRIVHISERAGRLIFHFPNPYIPSFTLTRAEANHARIESLDLQPLHAEVLACFRAISKRSR